MVFQIVVVVRLSGFCGGGGGGGCCCCCCFFFFFFFLIRVVMMVIKVSLWWWWLLFTGSGWQGKWGHPSGGSRRQLWVKLWSFGHGSGVGSLC